MNLKGLLVATLVVFGVSSAQAGLTIEPFLGTSVSGELKSDAPDSLVGSGTDLSSLTYGARLGYGMLGFSGGLEYRMGTGEIDDNGTKSDNKTTTLGLYAGYNFPILVRAWVGYSLSHKVTVEQSTGGDVDLTGTNMSVGVGFTGLPFVSINVEYHMVEFDEMEQAGTKTDLTSTDGNLIMVTVSAPLAIPFL